MRLTHRYSTALPMWVRVISSSAVQNMPFVLFSLLLPTSSRIFSHRIESPYLSPHLRTVRRRTSIIFIKAIIPTVLIVYIGLLSVCKHLNYGLDLLRLTQVQNPTLDPASTPKALPSSARRENSLIISPQRPRP